MGGSFQVLDHCLRHLLSGNRIAIDPMLSPGMHGVDHTLRRPKVHVCHPQRKDVGTVFGPFQARSRPEEKDNSRWIQSSRHCSSSYMRNISIPRYLKTQRDRTAGWRQFTFGLGRHQKEGCIRCNYCWSGVWWRNYYETLVAEQRYMPAWIRKKAAQISWYSEAKSRRPTSQLF